jgi:hypothetical protein
MIKTKHQVKELDTLIANETERKFKKHQIQER